MKKKITAGILSAIMIAGALSTGMAVHAAEPSSNFISGSLIAAARKELEAKKAAYKAMCDTIDKTIDKITKFRTEEGRKPKTIGDYMTLCKEDFDVITAYGEEALPHLAKIKDETVRSLRKWLIMAAQYQIDPSIYDLKVVSPDSKYTFVAHSKLAEYAGTVWSNDMNIGYSSISIYENETGKEVKTFTGFDGAKMEVVWSPDSRYVGATFWRSKYSSNAILFDTGSFSTIYLPYTEIYTYVKEDSGDPLNACCFLTRIGEIADDGTVRLDFDIKIAESEPRDYITGHLFFDPKLKISSEPVYEFVD